MEGTLLSKTLTPGNTHSENLRSETSMQNLNPGYLRQMAGFAAWLRTLNFEPTSQRDMPRLLGQFLVFLQQQECSTVQQITETHLEDYFKRLSERPSSRHSQKSGGLSQNYLRKHLQVVRKFARYLSESGQESFAITLKIMGRTAAEKSILTRTEIERLYEATADDTLGLRDRAMLGLYYGCGLRKKEGLAVNVSDVLLEKELVYVRRGKAYRERYVPLAGRNKADLEGYLVYGRPHLVTSLKEEALLISRSGRRLSSPSERLAKLKAAARIAGQMSLHTLRHSIATHLLSSGMSLEQIQHFLGHTSLESTQIYTHVGVKQSEDHLHPEPNSDDDGDPSEL